MQDTSGETNQTPKQSVADWGYDRFSKFDIEMSIPALFERQARATPRRTAVSCERQSLSYGDLNRVSNRIAHAILRRCGDKEEPVALLLRQGLTAIAATIGSLKSGKIYVPLEPNQPVHELQQIIAHCQPTLIIFDSQTETLSRLLINDSDRCLKVETAVTGEPNYDLGLDLLPDRVCYIFYTSGTTGPPKGVYDNHRNVLHNIMRYTNTLRIGTMDRLSLIQSCSFSGTVSSLFSALLNGAAICPFDLQSHGIARLASCIERERITVFHSTPSIFEQLMATRRNFDSLRMIRLEGDRAEPRHISLFQSHFRPDCVLVNGLGLTEAGIISQYFVTPRTKIDQHVVPVGHAIEDMQIDLVDDQGSSVKQGSVGEVVITSDFLACGYWHRPDLTKAAFVPDPTGGNMRSYHTGDLGQLFTDGCLNYLGRKDFQAKLRGQFVETAKIECALCAIKPIRQSLVLVYDGGSGMQQLVAYLVADGTQPSIESIRRALGQNLPRLMIPSKYIFMAAMPLDRNGKVDRRRLPTAGRQRPVLEQNFIAARNREEKIVAECFAAILNIDQVGINDDFLALGGDSLLATELLMMIEKRLGMDCTAVQFGQPFNVASVVKCLGQDLPESTLVPIQAGDGRAPLFCIHNYEGHVWDYFRLADCLGREQTVYGLQSRAFTKAGRRDACVEDMAAAYLAEITTIEPEGPYYLCGNCFGGTIAFEIAQQLRRQGRDVALLVLVDAAYSGGLFYDLANRMLDRYHRQRLYLLPARNWPLHFAQRFQDFARWAMLGIRRRLISATQRRPNGGRRPDHDSLGVLDRNNLAQVRYKPQRYDGKIVLICPGKPHNQRGWVGVAAKGCLIIEVPLDGMPDASPHLTHDPYVETLAAHISELLASQLSQ